MKISIPTDVLDILEQINKTGYEAYIVGGCVRDYLLGKEPNDWDITTSAKPMEIKKIFLKTVDTGIKHGTVTVIKNGIGYEVTTYRIDGEYSDCRHPNEVTFTPKLSEDLQRRDFTINAMAYHPTEGLVDLFGGKEDLENGIIRCVGNPVMRFTEDALRMMRAIRFAAVLNYKIDEATKLAITHLSGNLAFVSEERIQVEMVKLLTSEHPGMFRLFYETGLTKIFMPEFDAAMSTKQNHPHHMYDVGEHILKSVENIHSDRVLRLAMLFHDIAKPTKLEVDSEGITHFHGHPVESEAMAKRILTRLKFDNDTIRKVCVYCRYHDYYIAPDERSMRRAINLIGEDYFPYLFDVNEADTLAQSMYMREEKLMHIKEIRQIYEKISKEKQPVTMKNLVVNGKDLIACGIQPGKELGDILDSMLEDVLDTPAHNEKDYLLETYVKGK